MKVTSVGTDEEDVKGSVSSSDLYIPRFPMQPTSSQFSSPAIILSRVNKVANMSCTPSNELLQCSLFPQILDMGAEKAAARVSPVISIARSSSDSTPARNLYCSCCLTVRNRVVSLHSNRRILQWSAPGELVGIARNSVRSILITAPLAGLQLFPPSSVHWQRDWHGCLKTQY